MYSEENSSASEGRGEQRSLVLALGQALHSYGTPAHRLEQVLTAVAARLGTPGQFFSTPTALMASFDDAPTGTTLLRVEPGEPNLEKLTRLDALVQDVMCARIGAGQARRCIDRIVGAPRRYGPLAIAVSFAVVSGAAARFFGGGAAECASAAGIGLAIGAMSAAMTRRPAGARVFELVASLVAAALAAVAGHVLGARPSVTTMAGLIVLIPGLTLTVAMTELATRNLASGTARLMAAVIVFFEMAIGVALGQRLTAAIAVAGHAPAPLPWWSEIVALAVAAVALVALFQASPASAPWIVVTCFIGFYGARTGAWLLGPQLGAWLGAFATAVAANLQARVLDRPATVPLVPGLLLLVPGSLGFRGIASLLEQDTLSGIDTVFSMFAVAAAIVTGLLVANALVPPRRAL